MEAVLELVEGVRRYVGLEVNLADDEGAKLVIFDLLHGGGPLGVGVTAVSLPHAPHLLQILTHQPGRDAANDAVYCRHINRRRRPGRC